MSGNFQNQPSNFLLGEAQNKSTVKPPILTSVAVPMSASGHSLHFGSVSMSGLPPTTTEWRIFENGRNVPTMDMPSLCQVSVWAHSGGLKRFVPKCLLGPEKNTKLLGRSSDDRRKRFGKSGPNLWVLKNLVHRLVEFLNYWSGSSCRCYDSEPSPIFEASKINSTFPKGRNVRKFLQTLRF